MGSLWKPMARTDWLPGSLAAGILFVAAWGWFLYQGVLDPLGGINSLWPIFGIANQLLAVIALCLGTTVLIKKHRTRYLWVPLLPLAWLLAVTMTAGWMKLFSASPKLGFLSAAADFRSKLAAGGSGAQAAAWHSQLMNSEVDAAVTATFLLLVLLIAGACARGWWQLLARTRAPVMSEEPYVGVALRDAAY